ncbi:hypothetical protein MMPV_007694 [Pyropia vietnamensis]
MAAPTSRAHRLMCLGAVAVAAVATLATAAAAAAPIITQQPGWNTPPGPVPVGGFDFVSVRAVAAPGSHYSDLTFQWEVRSSSAPADAPNAWRPVANATGINFFPTVECPAFGFFNLYRVVITDTKTGAVTVSDAYALDDAFEPRPLIVTQPPLTVSAAIGEDVTYSWAATTTDPRPFFIWRVFVNGMPLSPVKTGAAISHTIPDVTVADNGTRVTANVVASCGGSRGARSEVRWAVGPSVLIVK